MNTKKILSTVDEKRIDVIPGIRVLAILLIAWFHIWQQSWLSPTIIIKNTVIDLTFLPRAGYLWVDMFILLSAYQLSLPYIRKIMDSQEFPRPLDFYKKRAIRIMPSYYVCIAICLVVAGALNEFYTQKIMLVDFFTHITFTQTFINYTYMWTNLNVVLWTVAILMQFYLLFPLIIRAYRKFPIASFITMVLVGVGFRAVFVNSAEDPSMMINQLFAFFDVFALGILGAYLTIVINRKTSYKKLAIVYTLLSIASFAGILFFMKTLADVVGHETVQRWQGANRLQLAILFMVFLVSTAYAIKQYRILYSNKVMIYLASVSYNYYIWHQYIAVRLKQIKIPPYISEIPNMVSEKPWQYTYTIVCFLVPLVIAILFTYLIDKKLVEGLKKTKP